MSPTSTIPRSDIDRVIELAAPIPEPAGQPALVLLVGAPGVGKTHFARQLRERVDVAVIESDAVRQALFGRPSYEKRESGRVFGAVHAAARELLAEGVTVVVDATNLIEAEREVLYRIADAAHARLLIVRLTAPAALIRKRLAGSGGRGASTADAGTYDRMRKIRQPIRRPHYIVDTAADTGPAVEAVVREIAGR